MKIKNKIHLFSTVFLLVLLITVNGFIYLLFTTVATNEELERLKRDAIHITNGIHREDVSHIDPGVLLQPYLPSNGMIRIINEKSKVVVQQEMNVEKPISPQKAKFERKESEGTYEAKGVTYGYVKMPIIWQDGTVVTLEITESLASTQKILSVLQKVLIFASLFILVPAFFAGHMLSKIILKPINSMIQTMEDIQTRGIFKKIPMGNRSEDELYKMGNTFNKMMDLLQQNFEKQQQFVSDASHELKTPLTVIESYAKLLKRWGTKKQDVMEESVEAIHSEAVRMKDMTKQMLLLANNSAEWNLDMKKVDLTAICRTTTDQLEKAYGRKFRLLSGDTPVHTIGDEQKLKQVLVVLLDNAMKYSASHIEVNTGIEENRVFFSVKDFGMGIPKSDLQKVFDRFFRVDKARSRSTGGTGLGLSIAKQIVDAHEGWIKLESEEGTWTTVTVSLPLVRK